MFGEYDTAGNKTGNLLVDDPNAVRGLHRNNVLFILHGCTFLAGHQKLAFLVLHVRNPSRYGRSVNVHIEDIKEDADSGKRSVFGLYGHHLTIGWRNEIRAHRHGPVRIPKKIHAKEAKYKERSGNQRSAR